MGSAAPNCELKSGPKALVVLLALGFAVSSSPSAFSSDWIEDSATTNFRVEPHLSQPKSTDHYVPDEGGTAMGVVDPGSPGSPPDQTAPSAHTLQGNVSRSGLTPSAETSRLLPQEPVLARPETKIVQPKLYKSWLEKTHPNLLGQVTKDSIVEVKGQWDDSSHVMHSFGFPHTKIPAGRLTDTSLAGTWILVVDCAGNVPPDGLAKIEAFVRKGGYLLTTDWALDGCLARAIPGYVSWDGGFSSTLVVDAKVVTDDPDLTAGLVQRAYWKLDNKSQTVHVRRAQDVRIIARSQMLKREDADAKGILALTFDYGKGKVLHLVGHFDNNSDRAFNNALSDPAPQLGISLRQAIAANFVALAIKAHAPAAASEQSVSPAGSASNSSSK